MEHEKIWVKNMEKTIITLEKKALRKEILKKRDSFLDDITKKAGLEKQFLDQCITAHILAYEMKNPCQDYLCYVNYKSEVSTEKIIEYLLLHEKNVYVPKVHSTSEMEFYKINSLSDLVCGYQNIPEPPGDISQKFIMESSKNYRMILPGSVFDASGNRIGYGGGYYDTYLQKCEKRNIKIEKIGIAYSLQIVENLPTETHDIKMDYIFTEKGNIL